VTDETVPMIVVPKGRSAAERRVAAIAALHQPFAQIDPGHGIVADRTYYICSECTRRNRYGDPVAAQWPCATAKLLGLWPGEEPT
jgi:hypothetical protein